jgi:phosphoribosylanthranilate isomerase
MPVSFALEPLVLWLESDRLVADGFDFIDGGVRLGNGLSPANVGEAIRHVKPYGVDLSSDVWTERT